MPPRRPPSAADTSSPIQGDGSQIVRNVEFALHGFAWTALRNEAEREGLTVEELVTFAVLYYLADIDSGRISRMVSRSPNLGLSEPGDQMEPAPTPDDEPL